MRYDVDEIAARGTMTFLVNVLGNLAANIAFWLLLGVGFAAVSRLSKKRFAKFFGVSDGESIAVLVSNLWSTGTSSAAAGYTISKHEFLATQSVNALLGSAPLRFPELARGLVDALWLGTKIRCRVEVSPPHDREELDSSSSLIVLGSSNRNSVRSRLLENGIPRAMFLHETADGNGLSTKVVREFIVRRTGGSDQVVRSDLGLALIERVVLPDHGRTIFFCLGPRADGTWFATEYLVRNWRRLAREFGDNPFVVCLGFPRSETYPDQYSEPIVLAQFTA